MAGCLILVILLGAGGYLLASHNRLGQIGAGVGILIILFCLRGYIVPNTGAIYILLVTFLPVAGGYLLASSAKNRIIGVTLIAISLFAFNDGLLANGPDLFSGMFDQPVKTQKQKIVYQGQGHQTKTGWHGLADGTYQVLSGKKEAGITSLCILVDGKGRQLSFKSSLLKYEESDYCLLEVKGNNLTLYGHWQQSTASS